MHSILLKVKKAELSDSFAQNGERSSWSGVPVAAVLCICLALFLFAVITLLCIRKLLQVKKLLPFTKDFDHCLLFSYREEVSMDLICLVAAVIGAVREVGEGVDGVVVTCASLLPSDWTARLLTPRLVWTQSVPQNRFAQPVKQAQYWHDCSSMQACSAWCGQLWSCYACHVIREQCQLMSCAALCPGCTACECPDFQCCGHCCHCKFKAPECTHINCLFCDLDCENTDQ